MRFAIGSIGNDLTQELLDTYLGLLMSARRQNGDERQQADVMGRHAFSMPLICELAMSAIRPLQIAQVSAASKSASRHSRTLPSRRPGDMRPSEPPEGDIQTKSLCAPAAECLIA
jgi:hypothetical protein